MAKILIIEDEENIRENTLEMLEAENFEVIGAANGQQGIELALAAQPDLIICDIMMPQLDGYGVLSQLRTNPYTETIPFVFLTAKTAKSDRRKGMAMGADDYLEKPFTRDELLSIVTTQLKKQDVLKRQSEKKLDELRGNLIHSLPHELHTPLNGIFGLSRLLIDCYDAMERDEALEMLEEIYASGTRLYRLTQNFLLYAQLEITAADPEQVEALRRSGEKSYSQAIITEVALQKAKQATRETDLHLELQEVTVRMPELKFRKILEEIIDNAFKFSPPETPIRVISSLKDNTFILRVIDRGRGMTKAQIANIGAYMQFERKLYEQQGSGLGLIIAKRLAELHGGRLTIESSSDKQTLVCVVLPGEEFNELSWTETLTQSSSEDFSC
ncbi:MAG: response regulator [Coleofasciculus sp. S288]|nr:response regulator [Coleofasciculus sp. S288]